MSSLELPQPLDEVLTQNGVRFFRVVWCDNGGVIRGKAIHLQSPTYPLTDGVGISVAQQAIPATADMVAPDTGLAPVGEVQLVPDPLTVTILPYAPTHVRALGDMYRDRRPWALCPRYFLRRSILALAEHKLEFKAAFENEFYLLRSARDLETVDTTPFGSTRALDLNREVLDDICEALVQQGILVEQCYAESGPGQFEISVRYVDAMQASDHQIAFRETVHAIAHRHGQIASFLPKIFEGQAGSGCHLHFSLWSAGENVTSTEGALSGRSRSFMAGILHHLPALLAITAPSPNSYRRLIPRTWSGAWRAWGMDNREAALRVPSNLTGRGPLHIELKTVDATANPYLATGAIMACGLDGLKNDLPLPEPFTVDPASVPSAEPLPRNLGQALAALEQDGVLLAALGEPLARAFIGVRRAEWNALQDASLDHEVRQLLVRY
ncbi:MAG TPA: glutamine synthetase family protein [Candidatus Xenobia bacterium]|jgi:glutamine synthetase